MWFIEIKFFASILILNVKYNLLELKYKNSFYLLKNSLDYTLAYYFANIKTTESNINEFLSDC